MYLEDVINADKSNINVDPILLIILQYRSHIRSRDSGQLVKVSAASCAARVKYCCWTIHFMFTPIYPYSLIPTDLELWPVDLNWHGRHTVFYFLSVLKLLSRTGRTDRLSAVTNGPSRGSVLYNQYVHPRNTRTEMYAGRIACCPLVSHGEYVPRALFRL